MTDLLDALAANRLLWTIVILAGGTLLALVVVALERVWRRVEPAVDRATRVAWPWAGRHRQHRQHRQHRHVNQSEAEARATAAGEAPSASGHPAGAAVPQHGHHEGTPPAPAGRPHAALAPDASITLDQLIQAVRASFDEAGVPITEATLLAWLASAAWYAGAFDPEPVAVQTQHLEHIEEVACVLHDQQAGGRW